MAVDLNCDMGEEIGNDELLMPYISSANIACGYHAGNMDTIKQTIMMCQQYNVAIGAHPSFNDRENFGRTAMNLSVVEIYNLVTQQLLIMRQAADQCGARLCHVKPHGALYNMSAKDETIANAIATAIKDFDNTLLLFGLSGSYSIDTSKAMGLRTMSEVFADRSYQDDGSLTPRSTTGALIETREKVIQQVLQMVNDGTVTALSGKKIPILAETVCIHGDGKHAVEFATTIYESGIVKKK
jgi:5-oxoprolinase (ATP-hydrolysing) subunit A